MTIVAMDASNRQLSDACKRRLTFALGQAAADEVEVGLETSVGSGQVGGVLTNPTLTGIVQVGLGSDLVGWFGMVPTGQPTSPDQAAAPALTAVPMTYVGVPDTPVGSLGDTGLGTTLNNQLATIAQEVNFLINDVSAVHTLVNRLRADLVLIGMIKGA